MADYHGDGRLDLLSGANCCQWPYGFYVFPRQPDGTFTPRKRVNLRFPKEQFDGFDASVQGLPGQTRVAVADWNGDGIPDLVVLVPTRTLGIVYGPLKGKEELTVQRLWPKDLVEPSWLTDTTSLSV
ncbi:MAG TPA: VCBS repeat-containing protein, partial [Gemmataceae bacterium]|nr:VCBS repeat-containing protein [Gemmataceae bacterium]